MEKKTIQAETKSLSYSAGNVFTYKQELGD